jgi:pyruvate carboxylase
MMKGELGQPPGGWPEAIQRKVLKGAEPIVVRPGSLFPPADLDGEREAAGKVGGPADDRALASHLMYPKVFAEFAAAQESYGPTEVLPTPTYFYGLPAGEEIAVELEPGKTLVVRCQAIGDVDEEGQVRVFFELNGQPRIAKVPDRAHGAGSRGARPKAEAGNPAHVAAPMPGVVSGVSVAAGQTVGAGDVLLSIEAMKMETALHAERDGRIAEVLVKAGDPIDAKDLLLRFE